MEEKVLTGKHHGMRMLLLTLLIYVADILLIIFAGVRLSEAETPLNITLLVISFVIFAFAWILFCGLKVLKPQEALVLTLFGTYVGTLKDNGFYWVNPFCSGVNPAAKTRLNQSGDVRDTARMQSANGTTGSTAEELSKKLSLKIMTLNNSRQKINDCLGNPIEIGIAVTWRIVDTAKAVFNVDNYKEVLFLQC